MIISEFGDIGTGQVDPSLVWWFSPYAALWESTKLESRVIETLAEANYSVTRIECTGLMKSGCAAMSSEGLTSLSSGWRRESVCIDCRSNSRKIDRSGLVDHSVDLQTHLSHSDLETLENVMARVGASNYMDLSVMDLPVGQYATYLSLLHNKTKSVTDNSESWREYLVDLKNSIKVLFAVANLATLSLPEYLVIYNPLYPANRVVTEYLTRRGTKLISVAAGGLLPNRFETMNLFPSIWASQTVALSSNISKSLATPPTDFEVKRLTRHLHELTQGNDPWVYSVKDGGTSPDLVRERLGVRPESLVVTVLLSSPDETRASVSVGAEFRETLPNELSTTEEFLDAVLECAVDLPELDFVVRLHPRMLPNKRESVVSSDVATLLRKLKECGPNVIVNTPDQNLSIYEVMNITDLAINYTSSSGLEFLSHEINVVHYDPDRLGIYPSEFGINVDRGESMSEIVLAAVQGGSHPQGRTQAIAWWTTILLRAPVDLADRLDQGFVLGHRVTPAPGIRTNTLTRIGKFFPNALIERLSRRMQRQYRLQDDFPPNSTRGQRDEILRRISAMRFGDVWEPEIVIRTHVESS